MHDNIRREHHLADGAPCRRLQARGRHHLSAALHDAAAVADFYRLANADTCCSRMANSEERVLHIIQRNDAVNVVHLCGKYQESKDDYLQKIVHWFED